MADSKYAELESILNEAEGRVLLVDHEFSDPDGLASKYTWGYILKEKFGLDFEVAYSKEMGHHKTQSLAKKLSSVYDDEMKNIEDISLGDYSLIMLVDVNLGSSNMPFTEEQKGQLDYSKVIVIDHHEVKNGDGKETLYEDIDEKVSSASTLAIEYMKEFGIEFSADKPDHNLLATALWIGFEIDARGKLPYARDFMALAHIIEKASSSMKEEIERGAIPENAYRASCKAQSNFERYGPYAVTYIGELKPDNKDIIAITAEELLKVQGVEATIAWALVDRLAIGSVRTTETSSISAKMVAELYNEYGFKGGGRPYAAGFNGSIGILQHCLDEDTEKIIQSVHNIITSKIKDKAE